MNQGEKMGLDQYLEARKYIDGGTPDNLSLAFEEVLKFAPEGLTKHSHYSQATVSYLVAYWRKANAVHGWFQTHLDQPVSNCEDVPVLFKQLAQLREDCLEVLDSRGQDAAEAVALRLLPPTTGFFFGSPEIDDWYYQDLEYTVTALTHLLATVPDTNEWSFYYRAWW
jgi:hypothetical protein